MSVGESILRADNLNPKIFMFNLRLPLAKWMPWLASSLVKVSNEIGLQK